VRRMATTGAEGAEEQAEARGGMAVHMGGMPVVIMAGECKAGARGRVGGGRSRFA